MQDDEDLADDERPVTEDVGGRDNRGLLAPKKEADYEYFVTDIWPKISSKEEKQAMTAPLCGR